MSRGGDDQAMRASGVRADPVFVGAVAIAAVSVGGRGAKVLIKRIWRPGASFGVAGLFILKMLRLAHVPCFSLRGESQMRFRGVFLRAHELSM